MSCTIWVLYQKTNVKRSRRVDVFGTILSTLRKLLYHVVPRFPEKQLLVVLDCIGCPICIKTVLGFSHASMYCCLYETPWFMIVNSDKRSHFQKVLLSFIFWCVVCDLTTVFLSLFDVGVECIAHFCWF